MLEPYNQARSYFPPSTSSSIQSYTHSPPSPMKRKFELEQISAARPRSSWQSTSAPGPSSFPAFSSFKPNMQQDRSPVLPSPPLEPILWHDSRPIGPTPRRVVSLSGMRDQFEAPRPSHLPPSLAALALTRPVDPASGSPSSSTLPTLDGLTTARPIRPPLAVHTRESEGNRENPSERLPTVRDILGSPRHSFTR